MARTKAKGSSFTFKEMDLKEAQRQFTRRRGRGSKYDDVITAAEKLDKGKALIVSGLTYSEVTGLRNKIKGVLGEGWSVGATKVDTQKKLYDVLIHRDK